MHGANWQGEGGIKCLAPSYRKPTASLFFYLREFQGEGYPKACAKTKIFESTEKETLT